MMQHQDRPDPAKKGPKQVMSAAEISRIQPSTDDCLVHVTKDRLILDARTYPRLLTCLATNFTKASVGAQEHVLCSLRTRMWRGILAHPTTIGR